MQNEAWTIVKPSTGEYSPDCLRFERKSVPALAPDQVLLETIYLSLDPTSRNWLKLASSSNVFELEVGAVMIGQTVSRVLQTTHSGFAEGDLVVAMSGWEKYSVVNPVFLKKVRKGVPLEANLTIFSHIGHAAMTGIVGLGKVREGETVLVSAAAGATGSIACRVAKRRGARVIGIAGGPEKCALLTQKVGVDAAIDYKRQDVGQALAELCPDGIDLFFDNVGGATLDAALMNMAVGGRIAMCGQIALYHSDDRTDGQGVRNLMEAVFRRIKIEGFIAGDLADRAEEFESELAQLLESGAIESRSHIIEGLENAADALTILFEGRNTGKLMVEVSPPPVGTVIPRVHSGRSAWQ